MVYLKRKHEHAIYLKEGEGLINVRLYRYPHHHKNKIEKQAEIIVIIRGNSSYQSSFSSPVVLGRKKYERRLMCVDYLSLNMVIIPDKFLILVIDELLDELHGAHYFY